MEEEESPRKVYVNSPIFTEEDAKTFQYVNPELGEELDEEGEYGAVEDPFPLHVNRKQRPNDYDQQQPANDDNEPDENDRPTLFRSSDWQYVVRQTDEKQTRNKQTYEDEVAERIEIEERTESHRDEVIRNNIPNLNLVDSEDDAVPTDSLELEISDGNHAAKPKHPAAKLKHPAAKLKHPANKPIGKVEILRDSLEDGDLDYQDDDRETDVFRNTREEGKVQEIFRNGYYLHDDGANHRKPIAAFDGAASRPVRNSSHQNAPSQNKKASQVHQYRNGNSNRSDEGLSIKVTREHGEHQFHELSSVHEHSRAQGHTATASPPQNTRYLQQNHEPHINTRTTHAPQTELPEDPNSFEPGGNQFSRGFAVKKPAAFSSSPEKDFVEGNKQLATKPPKTKKTYGEIYFKKKTQENPNTVLPSYTSPGRRKVFSADHIDTLQYSYEPDSQRVKEKRNSFRGQDDGRVAAAEDVWRSRAENLAKRKSSGQNGKPSVPSGIRKYPSESKMDLKRSDLNDIRSKAIYGGRGGEGGSAPYLSRHHPPHHLDPLQQQRQQQQQQQQQQPWVTTTNHQVVPNNMYVQDAAQQQLQQLQQHQLLQKQQYQQQLPQQQQFQQIQDQQQQQFQQQQFQQMQKQELHRQQVQQQHMQQQQLQQQQLHQQQLQQHQLQQQQLQQQQLQQQQLQQQPLYQQQQQQLLQQQQQQMKQQELQHQLNMQPPPLPMQQLNQQRQPLQRQQLLIQQQQRQADPSYGGNVNPVQHILTTEDGRKVSVDINLKVVKPSSQASGIPIQPGLQQAQHFPAQQQQMPYNGGYPATVYQPITGQVFQEVLPSNPYAPVVLNPGFHQVVGQQYAYSQLPVENHPKVMNQTGFPPQSYGTALPVSAKAEQSGQHLPPKTKHPMSPFRVLPPVAQPLRQQNNNGQTVPPLKFNDQTTIIAGRGLDEGAGGGGGGYMDQYQKQKNRQQDYKQYTLGDYRRLQKEAKLSSLGSLGPDVDSEYHRDKKEKALRQQEYAKQIKQRNRVELEQQRQRQGNLLSPSSANEQSESKAKRAIALDYAKNVPKPQTVIRSADSKHTPTIASSGKKQTIRNRRPSDSQLPQPRHHLNEDAEFWYQQQQHPLQPMTADLDIDFDELQKLRERHEQERQRLEMLLQNNHVVLPQNA